MSLIAWLPLTKTIENQGLGNYSITNFRGSTVYTNGKLGQCFYANGVNTLKINNIIPDLYNVSGYSLCAWAYIEARNTTHSGSAIISAGNWNQQVLNLALSDWSTDHYTKLRVSGTTWSNTYSYNFNLNTWYHIVVGSDGTKTYAYVNGALVGDTVAGFLPTSIEGSDIAIGGATYYTGMQFFGRINDVRVYDECLSQKQVKLLSQGLVAHYTLGDRYLEGTTNLITSLTQGGQTTISGNSVTTSGQNKDTYFTINLSESIVSGTQYTISCYAEGIPDDSSWTFPLGAQSNTSLSWVIHNGYNAYTFTANSINWGTNHIFMDDISRTFYGITKFSNFQLEKKDHATGYAGMGGTRNDTTVYDCSGYNNHLTAVNSPTIASDTARYSVSTHFNNGQYIIANENSNTGWLPTDSITVNLWTYITTWGNPISCTEGGGWNFEDAGGSSGIRFPIYVKGVGYVYKNSGVTTTSLLNGWHMLTGTFDKTTSKIYVDGELKGTATASTSNIIQYSSARLCISAEAQGTTPASSTMVGNISDVRIYATALSADDIQQLYNAPVSVSNNGAMFTQGEFIES